MTSIRFLWASSADILTLFEGKNVICVFWFLYPKFILKDLQNNLAIKSAFLCSYDQIIRKPMFFIPGFLFHSAIWILTNLSPLRAGVLISKNILALD